MSLSLLWPSGRLMGWSCASAGLTVCWSIGASAAPADCDKLLESPVPYEAAMKAGDIDLRYQVERSANGTTTIRIRNLDGKITKLENRSTFPISMTLPTGDKASFEYSVPTDKPLYDQKVDKLHMKLKHDQEVLVDTDASVKYLPDEKIKVGGCTYDAKHYVQTTIQNGRESQSEIWFSPGLQLSLKTLTTVKAGDKQMSQITQLQSVKTSFAPFK